ncbi:general secretion pathway protein M [Candidatus Nitrosoglobus terrae]|uniref:General secretion pathway protein M n=1 Tax=Candidatus Nitrosoglobus terrae TaxID=1630141 RepID=A0A1Q2SK84_9GAMM|nr:type II secretion system protein GspM [Candidatus Nitrosoglobus terrae]BAW79529.1 general secretion pathway protein M [Candidatus Nitrosoglobus terrae]
MNFHLPEKWHGAAAIGLLLLILLMIYIVAIQPIIAKHRFYQENIASMQQRLEKYQQIIASRPTLEIQLKQLYREQATNAYYLAQQSAPLAATELQRWVKAALEASGGGGTLMSMQNLPVVETELFPRVGINVRMNGSTEVLEKVLYDLESRHPLLFIDHLQVMSRQIRQRSLQDRKKIIEKTLLTISFELYGYMRDPNAPPVGA